MLTEQYELARIQEAKEIPTVNVIDPANLPEQKSFPPRLLLIVLFTVLAVAACAVWIIEEARFKSLDPGNPRRVLAAKLITGIRDARERLTRYPIVGWGRGL